MSTLERAKPVQQPSAKTNTAVRAPAFVGGARVRPDCDDMQISYEEALERAQPIAEVAKRNAALTEELKRLPAENVEAIVDSGLMPLIRPRCFGGFEADWITHIDCVAEVARHCGSTGWVMSFLFAHQFYLSYFPIETQRIVYAAHPDPKIATSFAPSGKLVETPEGYEISGRWTFCSGIDHCDWAIVGAKLDEGSGVQVCNFLLSPGQFSVEAVWNSVGLCGTGSNDIVIAESIVVPKTHMYRQGDALGGTAPGSLYHEGRMFSAPLALNSGFGVMSAMHGIARGAYESFVEFTRHRLALMGDENAVDNKDIQRAIGESKAEIDLAHLLTQKMSATAAQAGRPSVDDIVRTRRDFITLKNLLISAVNRLFEHSGARGLDQRNALQRHWRDLHAIGHHFTFAAPAYQSAGRHALDLGAASGDIVHTQ